MNSILRVVFRYSATTDLILSSQESQQYLDGWKASPSGIISGKTTDGVRFTFRSEDITALLIIPFRETPPSPSSLTGGIPPYYLGAPRA